MGVADSNNKRTLSAFLTNVINLSETILLSSVDLILCTSSIIIKLLSNSFFK